MYANTTTRRAAPAPLLLAVILVLAARVRYRAASAILDKPMTGGQLVAAGALAGLILGGLAFYAVAYA